MRSAPMIMLLLMFLLLGPGCTSGLIYTNVTFPLTTDMNQTPIGHTVTSVNSKLLQEPVTGLDISVEWDSRAIGDAARKAGFETFYFADMKTISLLGGLWEQQAIRVWGE